MKETIEMLEKMPPYIQHNNQLMLLEITKRHGEWRIVYVGNGEKVYFCHLELIVAVEKMYGWLVGDGYIK